jgi:hypothetical protein
MGSNGLMVVQYWTADGVHWAYSSSILDYGWSPVGSRKFNMGSSGLTSAQYWTPEVAQWAHGISILDYGWSLVGSWHFNIRLLMKSSGLTVAQY